MTISRSLVYSICLLASQATSSAQRADQQMARLGRCVLESKQVIEDCQIGYRTFGKLNASQSNAVIMPSWLYGNSGDLQGLFGDVPNSSRLVDTSVFFGIALDALGNGVSSSPSNSPRQHATAFPKFTTRDMVEMEYRVVTEVLHLKHAHAVIGLSMGGEQTFMWAVLHPGFFDLAVPVIATPKLTVFDLQTKKIMLEAIAEDPGYMGGTYTVQPALKLANLYNTQVVTSPALRNASTSLEDFDRFIAAAEAPVPMDANDRVWQLEAVASHDVLRGRTMEEAARSQGPSFFIIVNANDRMVIPSEALRWASAAGAPTYISDKPCGHLIMTCDGAAVSAKVQAFLKSKPMD